MPYVECLRAVDCRRHRDGSRRTDTSGYNSSDAANDHADRMAYAQATRRLAGRNHDFDGHVPEAVVDMQKGVHDDG